MAGSAILDPNVLVDSMVPVSDILRASLHPQFGVRPYRVSTVLRTWSGEEEGEGNFADVVTEITPQPRLRTWDNLEFELSRCGVGEEGQVKMTEVSLTYTYGELTGGNLPANQQFFLMVSEAHGQGNPPRYFIHAKPPFVDREKDMGWVLWLRTAEVPS